MILVDTSVWLNHLRHGDPQLADLLEEGRVLGHPFVLGEIAVGNLPRRHLTLESLRQLPQAVTSTHEEVLELLERERLFGAGVGYVDLHLLGAALLTADARLWTNNQRLHAAAQRLGVAANLPAR